MKSIATATDKEIQAALATFLDGLSAGELHHIDRHGCRIYMDSGDLDDVVLSDGPPDDRVFHERMADQAAAGHWVHLKVHANEDEEAPAAEAILASLKDYVSSQIDTLRSAAESAAERA